MSALAAAKTGPSVFISGSAVGYYGDRADEGLTETSRAGLVKIIAVALVDDRYRGPVNGVAPDQATSRAFARALGLALHRPAIVRLPALASK